MDTFWIVSMLANAFFLSANGQVYTEDVISTLMARLDEQQRQLEVQQRKLDVLHEVTEDQKTEIQRLTQLQNDMNQVSNMRSERQLPVQGTVAFTAVLTHALTNLGVNQNVVFDRVYTNVGNGYNEHHGVFTAPVSGIYAFHTTIFTLPNKLAYCGLVVNGVNKADVYAQGSTAHNAGSQMVVLELKTGDDVAVQSRDQSDFIHSNSNLFTTFSGFLLQDLSELNGGIVG